MTGFESVAKAAEESSPDFQGKSFFQAIWMAILVAILFYTIVIAAVGYVAPWRQMTGQRFMTAVAFNHAIGSRWIVSIILAAAMLSLLKVFNGNFVASSRLLFAMARRGLIDPRLAEVHRVNRTPFVSVLCVGTVTAVCMFLGDAILIPIAEVGSVAAAAGWLATCCCLLCHAAICPRTYHCGHRCHRCIIDDPDESGFRRTRPFHELRVARPRYLGWCRNCAPQA